MSYAQIIALIVQYGPLVLDLLRKFKVVPKDDVPPVVGAESAVGEVDVRLACADAGLTDEETDELCELAGVEMPVAAARGAHGEKPPTHDQVLARTAAQTKVVLNLVEHNQSKYVTAGIVTSSEVKAQIQATAATGWNEPA